MLISTSCFFKKCYLCALILFLFSTNTFAQTWRSGWVYIENVHTGLVIDVQGNVKNNGTSVWPYSLNYSKAQMFQFSEFNIPNRFGSNARYIMAYDNGSLGSDFYLSVKKTPLVMAPVFEFDSSSEIVRPELTTPPLVLDAGRPSGRKKTLRNYIFSIEEKHELEESLSHLISSHTIISGLNPKQIWKILPVSGEADTYYIQSAHFEEKMVIEPLDFSSGGTLVLSSFNGSDIQKWKILKTKPKEATNLKLSNFKWEEKYNQSPWYKPWKWHYVQKIKGKLSWTNSNASGLTKQNITIDGSSTDYDPITLEPNKTSYEFNIKSSKSAKTEEHCFTVKAHSKWKAQNWVFSDDLCENPDFDEAPPTAPTPPPTIGVSKLIISNCHDGRKSVRLWTYDLTVNDGVWKDHGTLGSQWQGSGCPFGSPKEINISDNHVYSIC